MTLGERLEGVLSRMLEWRKAAGYAFETHRDQLSPFVKYVGGRWPDEPLVTAGMVDGWLADCDYSPNSQLVFISCLRVFARFSNFEGWADFVPGREYSVRREAYYPHLFTEEQLTALFLAVDSYEAGCAGGRALAPDLVLPVWTRLLYCCGMRPGEPPRLRRADVDLGTGDVFIRQSKRHKDRHIIMSSDMAGLCARYDALCERGRTWFFERRDGKPYDTSWYDRAWRRILSRADVDWGGPAPRPYDLLHQFASANLVRWMDVGGDAAGLLPALSSYMGHSKLESTLYYVHLLPERLRTSSRVNWDALGEVYGGDGK